MSAKKSEIKESSGTTRPGGLTRREMLKALATLPVLGLFFQQFAEKMDFQARRKARLLEDLQLNQGIDMLPGAQRSLTPVPLRLGLIGFGSRGEDLARALGFAHPEWIEKSRQDAEKEPGNTRLQDWLNQDILQVTISGVCDVFELRLERGISATQFGLSGSGKTDAFPAARRYHDYREMLQNPDIDAVIIATPDHHHARMIIDAARAGKHIYCEKCMTRTPDEVYLVEEAVKQSGVVFQLGHQYHQNASFIKARQIIGQKILGKITLIETTSNRNTPNGAWIRHLNADGSPKPGSLQTIDWERWLGSSPPVPFSIDRYYNWTKWWDYATGLSGQLLSHEYDTINQLLNLGIPKSAVASGGIYFHKDNREIPDIFHTVFEFPDHDLTLIYSASLANNRSRGRVFMGHDASMELGDDLKITIDENSTRFAAKIREGLIDTSLPMFTFHPGADQIDAVTTASEKYYASRGLIYTYRDGKRVDTTHLHLREWLDSIRFGGVPSCGIDKAFEVTMACHMATTSYREKRRVEWDPDKRRII